MVHAKDSLLYAGLTFSDLASTEHALAVNPRAFEANPLLRSRTARVGISCGTSAAALGLKVLAERSGRQKLAKGLKVAFIAVKLGLIANNEAKALRRPR